MTRSSLRSTALLLGVAVTLPLLAADGLAAKTGLWETTTVMNTGGISIPAAELAKIPPAQRAQMEEMFRKMGAGGPHTTKTKSCVTEKDLQEGAFRQQNDRSGNCKYTAVTSTPKKQEWTFQCADAGAATGRMVVEAADNMHVRGTMNIKSPQVTMDMKFESTWLGASCAAADKK